MRAKNHSRMMLNNPFWSNFFETDHLWFWRFREKNRTRKNESHVNWTYGLPLLQNLIISEKFKMKILLSFASSIFAQNCVRYFVPGIKTTDDCRAVCDLSDVCHCYSLEKSYGNCIFKNSDYTDGCIGKTWA